MTWIVTAYGHSRSEKSASQWFSKACRAAGLKDRTGHGLRRTRATLISEAGATAHQIAAWTGYESLEEVEHYTRAAQRRRMLTGSDEGEIVTLGRRRNGA
ncbi:MAG: tyrosine-type recombinase/integrase [Rhodobacteraceae bacterium]|nr:tyrosine-type recombinase/integrase [Paracoccaceae bacterium]